MSKIKKIKQNVGGCDLAREAVLEANGFLDAPATEEQPLKIALHFLHDESFRKKSYAALKRVGGNAHVKWFIQPELGQPPVVVHECAGESDEAAIMNFALGFVLIRKAVNDGR